MLVDELIERLSAMPRTARVVVRDDIPLLHIQADVNAVEYDQAVVFIYVDETRNWQDSLDDGESPSGSTTPPATPGLRLVRSN